MGAVMTTQAYKLARTTDLDTSHEAAEWMLAVGKLGRDQRLAYDCICNAPGVVHGEVGDITGIGGPWKRCSDLHNMGLITYGPKRKYAGTGRTQVTLWPVENVQYQLLF